MGQKFNSNELRTRALLLLPSYFSPTIRLNRWAPKNWVRSFSFSRIVISRASVDRRQRILPHCHPSSLALTVADASLPTMRALPHTTCPSGPRAVLLALLSHRWSSPAAAHSRCYPLPSVTPHGNRLPWSNSFLAFVRPLVTPSSPMADVALPHPHSCAVTPADAALPRPINASLLYLRRWLSISMKIEKITTYGSHMSLSNREFGLGEANLDNVVEENNKK